MALRYLPFYPIIVLTIRITGNKGVSWKKIPFTVLIYLRYLIMEPFRLAEVLLFERKINHTPVQDPIFVLGHWRSGTTHLQQLLSLDDKHTTSNVYQFLLADCFMLTEKWLKPPLNGLCRLFKVPYSFQRMPMDLNLPGELESAMCGMCNLNSYTWGHLFPKTYAYWVDRFLFHPLPGDTEKWLDDYTYLIRKFSLASGGKRMIVKSPGDTARVMALAKRFPKARFVYIERKKEDVLHSTRYFWDVIQREISFQYIDQDKVDHYILSSYNDLMGAYASQRDCIINRLIEIDFDTFVRDPVGEMGRIYDHFQLGTVPEEKILSLVAQQKKLRSNNAS